MTDGSDDDTWEVPSLIPPRVQHRKQSKCHDSSHLFYIKTLDGSNIWDHPKLPHLQWQCEADDTRLHKSNNIYRLNNTPCIEKFVLKTACNASRRPLLGNIITLAYDEFPDNTIKSLVTCMECPLTNIVEFVLKASDSDDLSRIAGSMGLGERCIIRREDIASKCNEGCSTYRLYIYECAAIWRREIISNPPCSLVIDIMKGGLPTIDFSDRTVIVQYNLFKRPSTENVNLDPSQQEWIPIEGNQIAQQGRTIVMGHGMTLPCIELAISRLSGVGSKCRFFAPFSFSAGPFYEDEFNTLELEALELSDYKNMHLENFDLLFTEFEIVSISSPDYDTNPGTKVEQLKVLGNTFFKRKAFRRALLRYSYGLRVLNFNDFGPTTSKYVREFAKSLILNSVLCHMALKDWSAALDEVQKVLRIDPENVKALIRGAKCRRLRNEDNDLEVAYKWINIAQLLEPQDRSIQEERKAINQLLEENTCSLSGLRNISSGWYETTDRQKNVQPPDDPDDSFGLFRQFVQNGL